MSAPADAAATNVAEFTVSEISFALKRMVEENFEHVRVRGEISGFRGPAGSGHCYFTLKDERACIDAVIWKTTFQRLRFRPEEGLEMVATGKLTTFPGRSLYQIVVDSLEPAGAGALMALLQERLAKLRAEGLFDEARKRPLPYMPKVIGIVTSPTGAVIRDILHRLRDRCPSHVLVWPVRVQGDGAAEEVAAALRGFNAIEPGGTVPRPDLLIVARGGGSIEDLWAFNEEVAVRAVAASEIPTISAIGHETDWTLCDHAADRRAPTPTGAAEMAVPVRAELMAALRDLTSRHDLAMRRGLEQRRREAVALGRALPRLSDLLALPRQRLDQSGGRLGRALVIEVARKRAAYEAHARRVAPALLSRGQDLRRQRLAAAATRLSGAGAAGLRHVRRDVGRVAARLDPAGLERILARHGERYRQVRRLFETLRETASPEAMLARGYAIVTDASGTTIRAAAALGPGERIGIRFADGSVEANVAGEKPRPRRKAAAAGQNTLF